MGTRAKAKEIFIWSAWSKLGTTLLFKVLFGWLCKGHNEKSIFMLSYIYGLIACIDYLIQYENCVYVFHFQFLNEIDRIKYY